MLDSVNMLTCMFGACKIGLQWSIHRNVPSSNGIESRTGCGFQAQGLDSLDVDERWNFLDSIKKMLACMFGGM